MEHNDHTGAGKVIWIQLVLTPSERKEERNSRVGTRVTGTFMMGEVVCEPPKLEMG